MSIKLNNGTGNEALGTNSIAFGQGCVALGVDQTVLGSYPTIPTGDASNDKFILGGGSNPSQRKTVLRVTETGEIVQGGGEVYMMSPDTGEIIPVYMNGSNNRLKRVHLSI